MRNRQSDSLYYTWYVVRRRYAWHFDLTKGGGLTFDDGVVTAPVQENSHGFITTIVHLVSLNIATKKTATYRAPYFAF